MSRRGFIAILAVFIIGLISSGCGIGTSTPGVNQELLKVEINLLLDKYEAAYKSEDAEGVASCFTDPHNEVLLSGERSYSFNETKLNAQGQFFLYITYDCRLQNRNISIISGSSALATVDYYVDQELAIGSGTRAQVTKKTEFTLVKQGDSWKISKARPVSS